MSCAESLDIFGFAEGKWGFERQIEVSEGVGARSRERLKGRN